MSVLDKDVRLSPDQMRYVDELCRKRIRELAKKIDTANTRRLAGDPIQHGTLDRHYKEREQLKLVRDALENARKEIVRHFTDKLGTTPVEGENHGSA